ncbi:PorV/PorQ family protein [candidate division KSB1 bacterium]|nr:PorV/PorQ family protein [candidate division KSB1 bacterium]
MIRFLNKIFILIFCLSGSIWAANPQYGGLRDIFDLPVGANAMAMGGAFVATVDDPFALYWNPAALTRVPKISLALYMSNLPTDGQYNYAAYAHPTLFMGTFSTGIMQITTDDIRTTSDDGSFTGNLNYGRTLFLFGYGIEPLSWLSGGATLKIERAVFPGYDDPQTGSATSLTESSVGMDVGLLFTSQFNNLLLRNSTLGLNLQNGLRRSMRVFEQRENMPMNLRIGLARDFIPESENRLRMAFEIEKHEKSSVPTRFHLGAEYSWRDIAFLRMGLWDGQLTYGGGLKFIGMQLDYSYWSTKEAELQNSHRISLVFSLGKSIEERLQDAEYRRMQELEKELKRQQEFEEKQKINEARTKAKQAFELGNLIQARIQVYKALAFDEPGNSPEFAQDRMLLDQIEEKLEEQRRAEEEKARERSEAELRRQQKADQIREHWNQAQAYYQDENYPAAIAEAEKALELDPERKDIQNLKELAENDRKEKIYELVETGRNLGKQGRNTEAIDYYAEAKLLAQGNSSLESFLQNQIEQLRRSLDYEDLLRRAMIAENSKNWNQAVQLYKEALQIVPNNEALKEKYDQAYARANAVNEDLLPEAQALYSQGSQAFLSGDYEQALQLYQRALKIQPYNSLLLKSIDVTKAKINERSTVENR